MNTNARNRQSAGQPTGGQFATEARATDTGVSLGGQSQTMPDGYEDWDGDEDTRQMVVAAIGGTPIDGEVVATDRTDLAESRALIRSAKSHGVLYEVSVHEDGAVNCGAVVPPHWADDPRLPDTLAADSLWVAGAPQDRDVSLREFAESPWVNETPGQVAAQIAAHREPPQVVDGFDYAFDSDYVGEHEFSAVLPGGEARIKFSADSEIDLDHQPEEGREREGVVLTAADDDLERPIDYRTYRRLVTERGTSTIDGALDDCRRFRDAYRDLV